MFGFKKKSILDQTRLVEQVLEPTGGKILRPDDWFYTEQHREGSYVWTLSREDPSKGPYTTGVAIQAFVGVQQSKGVPAEAFLRNFAQLKQQSADRFLGERPEQDQGVFSRIGVETEEGPHHILYSLFWGNNDLDVAVVVVSGTSKKRWELYAPLFNVMGDFELIDMSRFD